MSFLGAVLTGGASRRMGQPKGLLRAPDGRLLAPRAVEELRGAGLDSFLVGHRALYEPLGLPLIDDLRPGEGPLAGLEAALLEARSRRAAGVVLVACDMPFFTAALVRRLLAAPPALAAAPRRQGRFEPLLARYEAACLPEVQARLGRGERAMLPLLAALGALEIALEQGEEGLLEDWDTPRP